MELLLKIVSYLPACDLYALACTSRLNRLAVSDTNVYAFQRSATDQWIARHRVAHEEKVVFCGVYPVGEDRVLLADLRETTFPHVSRMKLTLTLVSPEGAPRSRGSFYIPTTRIYVRGSSKIAVYKNFFLFCNHHYGLAGPSVVDLGVLPVGKVAAWRPTETYLYGVAADMRLLVVKEKAGRLVTVKTFPVCTPASASRTATKICRPSNPHEGLLNWAVNESGPDLRACQVWVLGRFSRLEMTRHFPSRKTVLPGLLQTLLPSKTSRSQLQVCVGERARLYMEWQFILFLAGFSERAFRSQTCALPVFA